MRSSHFSPFSRNSKKDFFTPGVKVHFIGIGGVGMCGLAELLKRGGAIVTGSDLAENSFIRRLKHLDIPVHIGHKARSIREKDVVVYSSAIPESNIELKQAKALNIPVIQRSEALAEMMRLKRSLVIAGTHGKTTTTNLLANIFIHCKRDPMVVMGGHSLAFNSTACAGLGDWFIAESDESDGSFKYLTPEIALITNIDHDHVDHYGSFKKLKEAFLNFLNKVPFYGSIIAWGDQKILKNMLQNVPRKILFYGLAKDNHFVLKHIKEQSYAIYYKDKPLSTVQMPLLGSMNALNSLGALVTAMTTGLSISRCIKALKHFKGVRRRLQLKGKKKGIIFYDDYAHHPTEIRAVLSALMQTWGKRKILVIFQPHRYSRTAHCWNNFTRCFVGAAGVVITDIYPAGEKPQKGITSKRLSKEVKLSPCQYVPLNRLHTLTSSIKNYDIVITMGAGDIYTYGERLLTSLK